MTNSRLKKSVERTSTLYYRHKPRILDLFCCAGGAARGYHDAGFAVMGVDIVEQPNYPYDFIRADAMKQDREFLMGFDAIHASPPCQAYSVTAKRTGRGKDWPMLIGSVRKMLSDTGLPFVIENVVGAPLRNPTVLCGTMFQGLRVIRHRLFETNFQINHIDIPLHGVHPLCHTLDKRKNHYGKTDEWVNFVQVNGGGNCSVDAARNAMGINWMTKRELNEAIPPQYTEFIGNILMGLIAREKPSVIVT